MRGRRITASVMVAALFAGIVGVGAYAIVSLSPAPDYAAPPKGTFLQDLSPDSEVARPSPPQDDVLPAAPSEAVTAPRNRRAVTAARPEKPINTLAERMEPDRSVVAPPPVEQPAIRRPARVAAALPVPETLARPSSLQPPVAPVLRRSEPHLVNVLTTSEIRRLKYSLRLTPEQEPHWPQVEAVLAEIGAEQARLARLGQSTAGAFSSATTMRIYWAAKPLLGTMREDQKAQIRVRARSMGLESAASYL